MTDREKELFYRKLGQNIKKAREEIGYSQSAFAQALQISRASIVNLEKGRQRPPLHLLYEIGLKTKVSVAELLPEDLRETSDDSTISQEKSWEELKKYPKKDQEILKEFLNNVSK